MVEVDPGAGDSSLIIHIYFVHITLFVCLSGLYCRVPRTALPACPHGLWFERQVVLGLGERDPI